MGAPAPDIKGHCVTNDAQSPHRLVLCTCPDADTATRLARALVADGLAACVNRIDGIESTYRWQGEVETDQESLLLIKTVDHALETLEKRIVALHPYELPEVIAVPITSGSASYLGWLESHVTATS